MPLDFADAISELEAVPLVDARGLLLLGELAAGSLEDDPIEVAGAELDGVAVGVDVGPGDSVMAPESIAAFLFLRVRLLVAAVASLLTAVLAGSVAAVSDVLLFFLFFVEAVSLGDVVLCEVSVAVSAVEVFFFLDFFVLVAVVSAAAVLSVAAAAWSSTLASVFAFFFFFFFLLVEVVGWSSVELVA
jgi:hypothetical protein